MAKRDSDPPQTYVVSKVDWAAKKLEEVREDLQYDRRPLAAKADEAARTARELHRLLIAEAMGLHPCPSDTRMPSRAYVPTPEQRHRNVILAAVHAANYTEEQTIQELFQAYERLLSQYEKAVLSIAHPATFVIKKD